MIRSNEDVWEQLIKEDLTFNQTDSVIKIDRAEIKKFYYPLARYLLCRLPAEARLLVAISGPPGCGKTAFGVILAEVINATSGAGMAVCIGLDGWHFPNAYLDSHFIEQNDRRVLLRTIKGSPETFDIQAAYQYLRRIRGGENASYPEYSRTLHDPVPEAGIVDHQHRLVLVEGNYLLLREEAWKIFQSLFDITVFLSADPERLVEGLRERHLRGAKNKAEVEKHLQKVDIPNINRVMRNSVEADILVHKSDSCRIDRLIYNYNHKIGGNDMKKIMISKGKYDGINAIADKNGIIAALAMDQRGSLQSAIEKARGGPVDESDMQEFKMLVSEILTPYASAILLDPEFGLPAITHKGKDTGVLLAYEKSGYDVTTKGRLPDLIPGWSVKRMHAAGADAIKLLVYYDPEDDPRINVIKQVLVEQVGVECLAEDIPFFLETVCYSDAIGDSKSLEFARVKPGKVVGCMEEFSKKRYAVDVLKVEAPLNMRYVEGAKANPDGQFGYSREQAKDFFRQAAAASRLPFIYLSAGVTDVVFRETLELAIEAGVSFSGVLCGRATWQDGIPEYARGGAPALRSWLANRGIQNIQSLNDLLHSGAMPWWDFYGGKENISTRMPD